MIRTIKQSIPNILTLGNLFCGVFGIILSLQGEMLFAAYLIGLAAIFDFLDGMVARLLGVSGELGKQLDSLADMVTFGVLPGIMLFMHISACQGHAFDPFLARPFADQIMALSALLVPLFAALRLARFNIDTRQSDTFIGVPTPAVAILVASFILIIELQYNLNPYSPFPSGGVLEALMEINRWWSPFDLWLIGVLGNASTYVGLSIALSLLMVSPFEMLSFKFKSLAWKENKWRFIFLILVVAVLLTALLPYLVPIRSKWFPFLDFSVVPIVLLLYLVYSLMLNIINFKK